MHILPLVCYFHSQSIFVLSLHFFFLLFFFNATATTEIYTLSLHDVLPISRLASQANSEISRFCDAPLQSGALITANFARSEEHTSELQSRFDLVCRLLLEKKKILAHTSDRYQSTTRLLPPS